MKNQTFKQTAVACLVLLTGCAMTDPRVGVNSRAGWISSVYTAEKLRTNPPACLGSLTPAQIDSGQYVEIKVPHGRRGEYLPAIVPPSVQVHLHDWVEFSPKLCEAGVVPEVKQVLSSYK
ncbi:hypothetical protein LPB67_16100 [Undibacterium sp. Jales W-56]|uniref:hypothetical protein n=1 Tax=Undibacterium sp. Jales W-56 TaxID=2897325 RepID=UPI0021D3D725|nr:hypothetical protein [Undibacterium sp. Jales W-56]MCU6435299.1 hypothetical protein [Undibacterium sp. Jales W-56]